MYRLWSLTGAQEKRELTRCDFLWTLLNVRDILGSMVPFLKKNRPGASAERRLCEATVCRKADVYYFRCSVMTKERSTVKDYSFPPCSHVYIKNSMVLVMYTSSALSHRDSWPERQITEVKANGSSWKKKKRQPTYVDTVERKRSAVEGTWLFSVLDLDWNRCLPCLYLYVGARYLWANILNEEQELKQ